MNIKAQTLGISIIVAITFFIVGMVVINILEPEITTARDSNNLNCDGANISDGTKLTCLAVDWAIPGFILAVLSIAGGTIVARFLL
jgi:heme/copper-type cytochrome/quinol oxidase subunit 2